jgi:hypothetical protein
VRDIYNIGRWHVYTIGGSVNKKIKESNFYYLKTYQEVVDLINKELPISLKFNEDLVNRVHEKYPLISKAETAVIIKGVFQTMRDILVSNRVIHLAGVFCHVKFKVFKRLGIPAVSCFIFTPNHLK